MTTTDSIDLSNAIECHGVDLVKISGQQRRGDCPFCDKTDHFFIRTGDQSDGGGQWDCKSCGEKGNVYTFLNKLMELSLAETTADDYRELWELKSVSPAAAKLCRVAKSFLTREWLFPTCRLTEQGRITNLNVYRWVQSNNRLFATDTLQTQLIGRHLLNQVRQPPKLIICEGHWDYAVLIHVIRTLKRHNEFDVLGVPGANNFKSNWCQDMKGYEEIILVYDADHPRETKTGRIVQPGMDGMKKAVKIIREEGIESAIGCINWPEGLKSGYDTRDLYISARKGKIPNVATR